MKILCFETSTQLGSVSLIEDGKVLAERSSRQQKSHSEHMNVFVSEVLSEAGLTLRDIDVFSVGRGPGSFTGIRVALNIGKTFSFCFNKPLLGIDSLSNLAYGTRLSEKKNLPIFSMINAYKNMVYFGIFKWVDASPKFIKGPSVVPVKSLGSVLSEECLVVGDGYKTYEAFFSENVKSLMQRDPQVSDDPSAKSLGLMTPTLIKNETTLDWKSLTPLYIRASEAEENKQGVIFSSL